MRDTYPGPWYAPDRRCVKTLRGLSGGQGRGALLCLAVRRDRLSGLWAAFPPGVSLERLGHLLTPLVGNVRGDRYRVGSALLLVYGAGAVRPGTLEGSETKAAATSVSRTWWSRE